MGGGESWLRACLKEWEAAHPGVMTYLRAVSAEELVREDAVLPDILLYTPGDLTTPEALFTPLSAYSFLVFVSLYTPCIAAVSTMSRELQSKKYTAFVVVFQILVAYLAAFLVYSIGLLFV